MHNKLINAVSGSSKIECPRGAFSLCTEFIVQKQSMQKICRSWTDGFTIISAAERDDDIIETVKLSHQEEYTTYYPRPPPAMPCPELPSSSLSLSSSLSDRKRFLASTMDSTSTSKPIKKHSSSDILRFVAASGVLHSFKHHSEIELQFKSGSIKQPSDVITIIDKGGATSFNWKDDFTGVLIFERPIAVRRLLPSIMHLTFTYTTDTSDVPIVQRIVFDTCHTCADCISNK